MVRERDCWRVVSCYHMYVGRPPADQVVQTTKRRQKRDLFLPDRRVRWEGPEALSWRPRE